MKQFKPKYIVAHLDEMSVTTADGVGTGTQEKTGIKIDGAVLDVYAAEILRDALPALRFFQFAETVVELEGAGAGDTLKIQKLASIGIGKKLVEKDKIETKSQKLSHIDVTIDEWGDAVAISGRAAYTNQVSLMEGSKLNLLDSYALTLDADLRDTALSGVNIMYAYNNAPADEPVRAGARNQMNEHSAFSVALAEDINEFLSTKQAPKYGGTNGYYICVAHPHVIRTLRDDSRWERAQLYNQTDLLFYGEVGRIANVRFIETTMMTNGVDTTPYIYDETLNKTNSGVKNSVTPATTYPVYKSVAFGRGYYGYASSLPMELRDQVSDFGRKQEIAWYSLWGSKVLDDRFGIVVETI